MGATRLVAISASTEERSRAPLRKSTARWMPALLTRTLKLPNLEMSHLTNARREAGLVMSQTRIVNAGICFFATRRCCRLRPQMITVFSCRTSCVARAKPIPVAPPVIKTVLPRVFMNQNSTLLLPYNTSKGERFFVPSILVINCKFSPVKKPGINLLAERVGFEPTCRLLTDNPISSRARYDRFGTSPATVIIKLLRKNHKK